MLHQKSELIKMLMIKKTHGATPPIKGPSPGRQHPRSVPAPSLHQIRPRECWQQPQFDADTCVFQDLFCAVRWPSQGFDFTYFFYLRTSLLVSERVCARARNEPETCLYFFTGISNVISGLCWVIFLKKKRTQHNPLIYVTNNPIFFLKRIYKLPFSI